MGSDRLTLLTRGTERKAAFSSRKSNGPGLATGTVIHLILAPTLNWPGRDDKTPRVAGQLIDHIDLSQSVKGSLAGVPLASFDMIPDQANRAIGWNELILQDIRPVHLRFASVRQTHPQGDPGSEVPTKRYRA